MIRYFVAGDLETSSVGGEKTSQGRLRLAREVLGADKGGSRKGLSYDNKCGVWWAMHTLDVSIVPRLIFQQERITSSLKGN